MRFCHDTTQNFSSLPIVFNDISYEPMYFTPSVRSSETPRRPRGTFHKKMAKITLSRVLMSRHESLLFDLLQSTNIYKLGVGGSVTINKASQGCLAAIGLHPYHFLHRKKAVTSRTPRGDSTAVPMTCSVQITSKSRTCIKNRIFL